MQEVHNERSRIAANIFVFFSIIPEMIIAAIPTKYVDVATQAEPPKIAPAIIAINGVLAPQGINVVVIIVIFLSRSFSIVLDAIIPGTPQPVPIRIGINDLPERPNLRNTLSNTNAYAPYNRKIQGMQAR